jgi:hypothetical protein
MVPDQQRADRLETRADPAGGHPGRQGGEGDPVTVGTAASVALILRGLKEHGRQIEDLVTARWGSVGRGAGREGSVTMSAGLGKEGHDVVAGVGRFEAAGGALVTGLAAGLSAGGRGLGKALGSGRRIRRGRPGGVLGVLGEAGAKLGDLLGELGDLVRQLGDLGEKSLAAGALGVGRAHTPGVRADDAGFLPT